MSSIKIRELEEKLFSEIQSSGLKHKTRGVEDSLREALENTTVKHPGTPNLHSKDEDPSEGEWI